MKKNGPFIRPPRFCGALKVLMIMKMTAFIILLTALQVSAKTYSQQKVTVDLNQVKLEDALKEVEKKSNYRFVFSNLLLPEDVKVTVDAKDQNIEEVLNKLLQNTGLTYTVMGNNLIVLKALNSYYTTIEVSGTITNSKGEPVANVSVSTGSGAGVISDEKGNYVIKVNENATLTFTIIGYATQEIKVDKKSTINVTLKEVSANLSEVVIVGYGTQSKQKVTSAVSTLKTDQFKDAPYTDIQSAVAGRSAGVVVNFSGGEPGSVPSMTIRGGEPLIGQTAPLYVIDGIIRDQATFINLNINDIENISFLKDAAATAVYGSKSSAGIVLVKTKTGVSGKPAVVYSNNIAFNTPSYFPKLINAYDKALVANAIGESVGNGKYSAYTPGQLDTIKNGLDPALYPNTDWYGLAFKKTALQQSHNLSVSGGSSQTKYYVGLGYFSQGSNYVNNSFKVNRFSYNSKIVSNFDEIGLNVAFALNGYYNYSTQPPAGSASIFSHIVAKSPFEAAYNKDGTLAGLVDHPLAEIYSPGYARSETFFNDANLAFTWNVPRVKGLSFRVLGDYSIASNPSKVFNVLATQYNTDGTIYPTPKPSLSQTSSDTKAYNAEFQADYFRGFGKHNIGATFVSIVRGGNNKWFSASRTNFPSTAIDQMFAGDASTQTNDGSASEWGEVGYVGRIKYDYAGRYLLELNGRYDGSDYFPPSKRFGFFPSISAGWIISSEEFYQKLRLTDVFSYLKFKASYGEVGSIGGTKYAYIPQYGVTSQAYVANGNLQNGYYEGGLTISNQNITWFKTGSRDFGLEFETLNKKLTGSVDYFYTRTQNILGSPAFRYTDPLGQSLPQVLTDAATRKEGIDFSLNYNWSASKDLKGYVGINGTYFNYLWERTNEDSATLTNPYTRAWGVNQNYYSAMYSANGLYQNYADILNNPSRLTSTALSVGDVWLEDTNGDGKIDAQDFRRLGLSQSPRFTFGIPFGIEYKGIRLDALIQGTGKRDVYLGNYLQGGEGLGRINFDFQKDFWTSSNTSATFPRAGNSTMNSSNNYTSSSFWLKDAGFVRLKSLTLSYNFKKWVKTKIFSDLSAHISGTNLLTFSSVKKYFDPELANNNNFFYPVNRTYSVGIRVGF
ncbi:SusC/RagA family TonB-linked outer membrane protein [Danxiaibacter flavus]|uniref:SusC/RagA family TonB-linked outer membrane protein n=1 Tax=Danxiaibacter flavus TaxID=3049108 RepID=A0ABV3ZG34_9BACT|nr:SusC/RagA family TonB-linked outer membrane protein [Chitinophagaceae bacterium DXS]